MSPLLVVGDADTVLAFALGGISGRVVRSAADARRAVTDAIDVMRANGASGGAPRLLVITCRIAEMVRDILDPAVLNEHGPLVLEIPGFDEAPGRDPVGQFVERVLGVRL